jgi:N-acetylmuramoyl-L-alanine amidase
MIARRGLAAIVAAGVLSLSATGAGAQPTSSIGRSEPTRGHVGRRVAESDAATPRTGQTGAATDAAAIAIDARLVEKGQSVQLQFDLSRAVGAKAYPLADPDRIVVDLPEVSFQIAAGGREAVAKGLVKAFRYGHFAPGRSRVVIDLARPARIVSAAATALSQDGSTGGPARLAIELAPDTREAFRAAAKKAEEAQEARATEAPIAPPASGKPIVVIDPGHGGVDPGASTKGQGQGREATLEKDVVLDFARDLAGKIEKDGRYVVVMTRRSDHFVPLDERVRIARSVNAALFLSVHADSLQGSASVMGATVYTVSDKASDAEAARLAESENSADRAAGADDSEKPSDVNDILFDLTRRETRAFANVYSRSLAAYLGKTTPMHKNPHRSAGFRVLKAPDVPSVLLELGYLSSEKDAQLLTSPEWRDKATSAVATSVLGFLAQPGAAETQTVVGDAPTKTQPQR